MTSTDPRTPRLAPRARLSRRAVLGGGGGLLLLAALAPLPAVAQIMLYENRLPDGYAYVRFANTLADALVVKPQGFADTLNLGTDGAARVSFYHIVEGVAGKTLVVDLAAGGISGVAKFELKPGAFHTVLIGKEGAALAARVVPDQAEINQTRARLAFYNAVPDCPAAGLQLDPGGQSVFSGVGPNSMRGRSVNPAANPHVRASCGTTRIAPLDLGSLDAGGQYSVWMMAPAGAPVSFMSKNTIAPYLR